MPLLLPPSNRVIAPPAHSPPCGGCGARWDIVLGLLATMGGGGDGGHHCPDLTAWYVE